MVTGSRPIRNTRGMSHYHTREAFDARMAERRASPTPITKHAVFYHAALMHGWESIVAEQMAVCARANIWHIHTYVLAPDHRDFARFQRIARHYGVQLNILGVDSRLSRYEIPTLDAAWIWATNNTDGALTYFHSKGASAPNDRQKQRWRRVMGRINLAEWETNVSLLTDHDIVGAAWSHSSDFPHFPGNFWAARCDWLASLDRPEKYRASQIVGSWAGHPWDRMSAELWLGSKPYHAMFDRLAHGHNCLHTEGVYGFPFEVEGVDYEQDWFTASEDVTPKPSEVTVVIPSIPSRTHLLARAVRSAAKQTCPPSAISVVIDAERKGAVHTRNKALEQVGTKWTAFLDDDDELYPDHLEKLAAHAETTGADYVFSYFDLIDKNGRAINEHDPLKTFGKQIDPDSPHQTTITVLVRTELAKRVGFREPPPGAMINGHRHGEDYQFTLDCIAAGATLSHLPERTWAYHMHGENTLGMGSS